MPELYTAPALSRLCGIFLNPSLIVFYQRNLVEMFLMLPTVTIYNLSSINLFFFTVGKMK